MKQQTKCGVKGCNNPMHRDDVCKSCLSIYWFAVADAAIEAKKIYGSVAAMILAIENKEG